MEPVDANEILKEAARNSEVSIASAKGTLSLKCDAENCKLLADRLHLVNLLYNLIDNAIKYSGEKPSIEIRSFNNNQEFCVSVSDNGMGISEDSQRRIFHKFYRVPTGNVHNVKGFGLGLYYVKLVADAHGGKVSVESKIGTGSTFTVQIPLAP